MSKEIKSKNIFVGVWDYTVILTYLSAVSAIIGIGFASSWQFTRAAMCLVFSAACDTFDGKVARTKKNRSEEEKLYGIQIDSMCDLTAFGIFPAVILFFMGGRKTVFIIIGVFFVLCSVIRLSWFNVLEMCESGTNDAGEKVFHGLPMPSSAIILPWIICLRNCMQSEPFLILLGAVYVMTGIAFIADVQIKKPGTVLQIAGIIFAIGGVVLMMVI